MKILPSECDCKSCSSMCHAPCCGTPKDMQAIMDAGYGDRLMLDDLPGGENMLRPALKGHEGKRSPWEVYSKEGCTFWKNGKCELHEKGLKPLQAKLAHHDLSVKQMEDIGAHVNKTWATKKAANTIEKWKKGRKMKKTIPPWHEQIQKSIVEIALNYGLSSKDLIPFFTATLCGQFAIANYPDEFVQKTLNKMFESFLIIKQNLER